MTKLMRRLIGVISFVVGTAMIFSFFSADESTPQTTSDSTSVVQQKQQVIKIIEEFNKPKRLRKINGVWALVKIPRLGHEWLPVNKGVGQKALSTGLGHWPNGTAPGETGNYVVAGHRVTHTEPFKQFPSLRKGDRVFVRTSQATYIYVLDMSGNELRVDQYDVWVTENKIQENPYPKLITLITCAETFHTDDRYVAFGHLVDVQNS